MDNSVRPSCPCQVIPVPGVLACPNHIYCVSLDFAWIGGIVLLGLAIAIAIASYSSVSGWIAIAIRVYKWVSQGVFV